MALTCPGCGASISDAAPTCASCGRTLGAPAAAPTAPPSSSAAPKKATSLPLVGAVGCLAVLGLCCFSWMLASFARRPRRPESVAPIRTNSFVVEVNALDEARRLARPLLVGEEGWLLSEKGGEAVTAAVSDAAFEKFQKTEFDRDNLGFLQLTEAGLITQVPDGTPVLKLSGGSWDSSHVRLLGGANFGREVVVPSGRALKKYP